MVNISAWNNLGIELVCEKVKFRRELLLIGSLPFPSLLLEIPMIIGLIGMLAIRLKSP